MAVRQNRTDAGITSLWKTRHKIDKEVYISEQYKDERWGKLNDRLGKIMKKLATVSPVNKAKMIKNAIRDCMDKMVELVTEQVVDKVEKLGEKRETKEEI